MRKYVAFLRGINVGGNSLIKMSELQNRLLEAGLHDVKTYIQSGNIIFQSEITDKSTLAALLSSTIKKSFQLDILVALFSKREWQEIIKTAPPWWGRDKAWKHNIFIVITPDDATSVAKEIGSLKPDVEALQTGKRVLYQSIALNATGKGATGSKLVSGHVYAKLTIRNYNTATKLASLLS